MAEPSPLGSNFRRQRVIVGSAALAVLGASFAYAPFVHSGPVVCPLHGLIGLPCPSCGLTRAFCALSHWEIGQALHFHALSPLLFSALLATPFLCTYEVLASNPVSRRWLYSPTLARLLAAAFAIYHVGRVALWAIDGTLVTNYVQTSWTHSALSSLGWLP